MRRLYWLACAVGLLVATTVATRVPSASASDLLDRNVSHPTLKVHGNKALVEYEVNGRMRHVLVWGAVNARTPDENVPQVRFKRDYSGGWGSVRKNLWTHFKDQCRPYTGPPLAYFVAACTAPDGSWWALQSWQRNLPHRGVDPWTSSQSAWELRISHWTGEVAHLELYTDWAFRGAAHDIFGRMTYGGQPIHGFHSASGVPLDGYGRSLYIDTYDSVYGPGWKRETSILFRKPYGDFCYSFWPTHDVSLPGSPARPAGNGTRYRISVVGPGVTPDVVAEAADLGPYNPQLEQKQDALFSSVIGGDPFCATQR